MKLEVIESQNSMQKVWRLSRPYLHEEDIPSDLELMKMNLPINQFRRVVMHITSSILFRDLLFTFRPINVWARSNRTIKYNHKNIRVADDEVNAIFMNALTLTDIEMDLYQVVEDVMNGEKQDYAKVRLPLMTETEFCIDIDYRHLINIVYTFSKHCSPLFKVFFKALIDNQVFTGEEYREAKKVDLYPKVALSQDELDGIECTKKVGGMYYIKTNIQANLMAQFIRQHSTTIKNGIWNLVDKDVRNVAYKTCETNVDLVAYILESQLSNLVSTRTCWFAQFDKESKGSWSYILKDLVKDMDVFQFMEQLPCGGNCKCCGIEGDMIPRVKHTEVNPPCPILIENPYIIDQRKHEYESNSAIMEKWEECKPYIKYNPNNPHNETYSELTMESGTNVHMEN